MYQDQKNRAYSNIITSLFPEQTKTVPRIIIWSIILIADLILGAVADHCLGIELDPMLYSLERTLHIVIIFGVGIGAFLLETYIWNTIAKLLR